MGLKTSSTPARLYFGYGSNLWRAQMALRCPASTFQGVARLPGYRWIINSRGYANVVAASASDCVWGVVYALQADDEERLDANEGVPESYTKEELQVGFWAAGTVPQGGGEQREMLVYIDRVRLEEDVPKAEYVERMNEGIADALREGVPAEYVQTVLRRFIPDGGGRGVSDFARRQAMEFVDEN